MYEALNAIVGFAKIYMGVKEINACIYTENHKSINIVTKMGFVLNGSRYENFRGIKYLHNIYSLRLK